MKKLLLLCGGISGEHEISLISAKHVLRAIDKKRFKFDLMLIEKNGVMGMIDPKSLDALPDNPREIKALKVDEPLSFRPFSLGAETPGFVSKNAELSYSGYDAVFPILHGEGGEDGRIQGFFETAGLPIVGCGLKASSVCMDKILTKKICRSVGLPIVEFQELRLRERDRPLEVSYPCFVKPASGGSSLGVSRVDSEPELSSAMDEAFRWDDRILIEPAIRGREIEVAVLQKPDGFLASPAGEILCSSGFYSYEAKYVDDQTAKLIAPAELSSEQQELIQKLAVEIFEALECQGMARVDFFLDENGDFLLNEVNSIPGFTPISMYPRLMQLAGVSYPDLITSLIETALNEA